MQDISLIDTTFSVLVLLFSVVAHEVSHGYAALALGDTTAARMGRLTMNPLKHIDLFGSIIVPLITIPTGYGFGMAKPVPYNPYNLRDQKWGDTKVALAGPLTNLVIALIFGLLLRFAGATLFSSDIIHFLVIIVVTNLSLAVFNLIPIPPLDGSKLLINATPYKYRYIIDYLERYSFLLLVLVIVFLWAFISPLIGVLFRSIVGA
jgi:Zn-dependent protease